MAVRRIDGRSGQVYTETEFAPATLSSYGPAWIHETPFLPITRPEMNVVGAPSLMNSAIRKILSDQRNLTPQLFTNVPWYIASRLWDYLGRNGKRTLYMWKLFATAYPVEFQKATQYRSCKILGPRVGMRDYLGLVKSDTLSWRVVLTLGVTFARVPELVEISEIKNLVALEILTPASVSVASSETEAEAEIPVTVLSDRILRTWGELAQSTGAFSHLRVLILQQQMDLSRFSLRYLRMIPSLRYIVAHACPGLASAFPNGCGEVEGWKTTEAQKLPPPETLYEFYRGSFTDHDIDQNNDKGFAKTPILDFQIGQRTSTIRREQTNNVAARSILYLQRTEASQRVDPEPNTKKRKGNQALEQTSRPLLRSGKAVMRNCATKDLGDVLKDFL